MSETKHATVAAFALLALAAFHAPAAAQEPSVRTTTSTGLFTVNGGHRATLTLVETGGSAAAASEVTLEIVDGADRTIARHSAQLEPGQPVRLHLSATQGTRYVRARARVTTSEENLASAPILTFEVHNQQSLDAFAVETCLIKYDPKGTSGPVLGDCGGCSTLSEPVL
jgi:hypothetical protein